MRGGKGRGRGRGKNNKNQECGNPLDLGNNDSSLMAAVVHHSGISSTPVVPLQPVTENSTALPVPSPGINSLLVPTLNELAQSQNVASSQLTPNMPVHQLLALMSSHPALQTPEAQAYATNLVIQNHTSLVTLTPQGPNVTTQNSPAGPRFPVSVLQIASANTLSASSQPSVSQYAARRVCYPPSQNTLVSWSDLSNGASSPLDLSRTTETGNNEESRNTNQNSVGKTYNPVGDAERVDLFNVRHLVRTVTNGPTPEVVWRFVPRAPAITHIAVQQSTLPSEASASLSNNMANLGNRATEIIANASRTANNVQLTERTDTNAAPSSQENVAGELQGTSSTSARSSSAFHNIHSFSHSGLTPPYHEGVAYQRPDVLQYPGFNPSNRPNGAIARVRTSSSVAPTLTRQAQSGSVVARPNTRVENSSNSAVTLTRALNRRVRQDTLHRYEFEDPQGYYFHLADGDRGRRHVLVNRKSFEDTFLRHYINLATENANLWRVLRIAFFNDDGQQEPAADAGGPRGEYISMLRSQLRNGFWEGFPLFDYGDNGLLPTRCDFLGDNGTFVAVGLAFADLIFYSGASIDGLSPHLIELLKKMNSGIPLYVENVKVTDLLDEDVREAFEILTSIANKQNNPSDHLERLQMLVMEWHVSIPDNLNYRTALQKRNSVVQSYFVKSRFSALWDFFEGLKAGGVMQYLEIFPQKWESLFPRKGCLIVTVEELLHNIEFRDQDGIILSHEDGHELQNFEGIVRQYITNIAGDAAKVRHFLMCVSGFDVLTPGKIFVEPQSDPTNEQVKFSACGKKIIVPVACNLQYFTEAVELDLDFNRG